LRSSALRFQITAQGRFQDFLVRQLLIESIPSEPIVKLVIDP
jgi:hypothetical protein